jgi:hypothetical protein
MAQIMVVGLGWVGIMQKIMQNIRREPSREGLLRVRKNRFFAPSMAAAHSKSPVWILISISRFDGG